MRAKLKSAAKHSLTLPAVRESFRWLVKDKAIIFMLHRFADAGHGVVGLDAQDVRTMLALMRNNRVRMVSLLELVNAFQDHRDVTGTVCFTLDDGYAAELAVAADLFAEFECPLSVFLATGVVDDHAWFWWDKIEWTVRRTAKTDLSLIVAGQPLQLDLSTAAAKERSLHDLIERCKNISEPEKRSFIVRLANAAEVDLPSNPPEQFRSLTWDEARAYEQRGICFGPHSVSHPILSRLQDTDAAAEVRGSWMRLQEKLSSPIPIFAYPNGREVDFGAREIQNVRRLGMRAAVSAEPGYVSVAGTSAARGLFRLPRFAMPSNPADLIGITHGLERVRQMFRS